MRVDASKRGAQYIECDVVATAAMYLYFLVAATVDHNYYSFICTTARQGPTGADCMQVVTYFAEMPLFQIRLIVVVLTALKVLA